ncbi:MAG TPA: TRAM domain-containing protein [Dermatophilaceae bacterium]|nr:TRAM domain-containing protein [Dermatophilaceae bacterium]
MADAAAAPAGGPGVGGGAVGGPGVGDLLDLEVGRVAHGGHCVARADGRVVFVRHAIPGERVTAVVTEGGEGDRFLRADAVAVLDGSADRVPPPCPHAVPGGCGGCDLQHVAVPRQRTLKAEVVREQLARLAGLDLDVTVEPLPGSEDGLGWRTRVELALDPAGRPGLHRHRSHEVVPLDRCLIAAPEVLGTGVLERGWPGEQAVDVVVPSVGEPVVVTVPSGDADAPRVIERVDAQRLHADFELSARGFWQVHRAAAATLTDAVLDMVRPAAGERVLDLYAGVGLFAAALAEAVGEDGRVVAVESDRAAAAWAQSNLGRWPWAHVLAGRVDDAFGVARPARRGPAERRRTRPRRLHRHPLLPPSADVVVLDPTRTGAGRAVVEAIADLAPRAVGYVACDPAALARDTAYLAAGGYALTGLRAFDAFPMTHHVECVALFTPRT